MTPPSLQLAFPSALHAFSFQLCEFRSLCVCVDALLPMQSDVQPISLHVIRFDTQAYDCFFFLIATGRENIFPFVLFLLSASSPLQPLLRSSCEEHLCKFHTKNPAFVAVLLTVQLASSEASSVPFEYVVFLLAGCIHVIRCANTAQREQHFVSSTRRVVMIQFARHGTRPRLRRVLLLLNART